MKNAQKGIKAFLNTVKNTGVSVKSLFEVSITYDELEGEEDKELAFYITDIDLPGKKLTTSTLYRNGREYDIPIIYDNNREFTMTVLCDEWFGNYVFFEKELQAGKFGKPGTCTIIIRPTTGIDLIKNTHTITLEHVFFETLGSIQFSHNSKELITFTVSGRFRNISIS